MIYFVQSSLETVVSYQIAISTHPSSEIVLRSLTIINFAPPLFLSAWNYLSPWRSQIKHTEKLK